MPTDKKKKKTEFQTPAPRRGHAAHVAPQTGAPVLATPQLRLADGRRGGRRNPQATPAAGRPVPFNHAALNKVVDLACDGITKVLEEEENFWSAIERGEHAFLPRLFTGFREYVGKAELHPVGQQDDKRILVNKIMRINTLCSIDQHIIETAPAGWQKTLIG